MVICLVLVAVRLSAYPPHYYSKIFHASSYRPLPTSAQKPLFSLGASGFMIVA